MLSELSGLLGNGADGHSFDWQGKTYPVKCIDQAAKVAYEKRMYAIAKKAVAQQKVDFDLTTDEYVALLANLSDKYARGDFAFGAKKEISFSHKGLEVLFSVLSELPEQDVLAVMIEEPEQMRLVLDTVLKESFPGIKKRKLSEPTDPKA